jgi:replication-associated recombination protein RarA
MANLHHDPWAKVKTKNGLQADQVISALQKEIRRGNVENACLLAYEMIVTSASLENFLWERLKIISVEDIGLGEPNAPVVIQNLYTIRASLKNKEGERRLLAFHATRYLCHCKKDRTSDEMLTWIQHTSKLGKTKPVIPDYAIDTHTAEGKEKGRGHLHFFEEASKVLPEIADRDKTYLERIIMMLKNGEIED